MKWCSETSTVAWSALPISPAGRLTGEYNGGDAYGRRMASGKGNTIQIWLRVVVKGGFEPALSEFDATGVPAPAAFAWVGGRCTYSRLLSDQSWADPAWSSICPREVNAA
jgi:hypothetical protein